MRSSLLHKQFHSSPTKGAPGCTGLKNPEHGTNAQKIAATALEGMISPPYVEGEPLLRTKGCRFFSETGVRKEHMDFLGWILHPRDTNGMFDATRSTHLPGTEV